MYLVVFMNETRNICRILIKDLYGERLITKNNLDESYANITLFSDVMPVG
jgi:hypothetical protein